MTDDQNPPRPPPLLDWHDRRHWARAAAPCRHCIGNDPTHLRDDDGLPAHKVCAEAALAEEHAHTNDRYQNGH